MELTFAVIITVLTIYIPLAALLSGLRHALFGLHTLLVVGGLWLLNQYSLGQTEAFAAAFYLPLACLHIGIINIITYLAYYMDKQASRRGGWRISERTLHHLAFIGGSPAALLAQQRLRHKTQKTTFKRLFWAISVLQVVILLTLLVI